MKLYGFLRRVFRRLHAFLSSTARASKPIKCVIVGDPSVDKSSLRISFLQKMTEDAQDFGISSLHYADMKPAPMTIWDTSGQEDYDSLRKSTYDNTDVFLLCYDEDFPQSLENAYGRWLPEVRCYCPNASVLLVGMKSVSEADVKSDCEDACDGADIKCQVISSPLDVTPARKISLESVRTFMTCPISESGTDCQSVFEEAARIATKNRKSKSPFRNCKKRL